MFRGRHTKHNNAKRTVDTYVCDSWAEGEFYLKEIKPRLERGEIKDFEFHPTYVLVPGHRNTPTGKKERKRVYEADFRYVEVSTEQLVIVDVKGFLDQLYRFKANLFRYLYPDLAKCYLVVDAKDKRYSKPRQSKKQKIEQN